MTLHADDFMWLTDDELAARDALYGARTGTVTPVRPCRRCERTVTSVLGSLCDECIDQGTGF